MAGAAAVIPEALTNASLRCAPGFSASFAAAVIELANYKTDGRRIDRMVAHEVDIALASMTARLSILYSSVYVHTRLALASRQASRRL